jgi:hypothetical protein
VVIINALILTLCFSVVSQDVVPWIKPSHQVVIDTWLQEHPGYRIANEKDCNRCEEQLRSIRKDSIGIWKPVPSYQPYYVMGDFNGDGNEDFAVVVISNKKSTKRFVLLVFNAPFDGSATPKPSFVSEPMNLASKGLFFGPPRPKPYRLIIGPFESEGEMLLPKGNAYIWER